MQIFQIGDNPLTTTGAMDLVEAAETSTSALQLLDLTVYLYDCAQYQFVMNYKAHTFTFLYIQLWRITFMLLCRSAFNKENRLSPIIIHDPLINTCQIKYQPSTNTIYGYILKLGKSESSIEI